MTVASAMRDAALRVAGYRPAAFFGSTQNLEQELADWANEVANDVAQYQDWQALVKVSTLNPNGQGVYTLPSDYDRMMQASSIQSEDSWLWGYFPYTDINQFFYDKDRGAISLPGGWIRYGDQLHFAPVPTTNARLFYISKNWARGENGNLKPAFTDDDDEFLLPDRLLTLGIVWRWRENKGLDASGDQEAFIKAMDEYAAKDRGSRVYRRNSRRFFGNARVAWPGTLGPATYPTN